MSAKELRALGHPLRLQILQVLHAEGPSTASGLARRLGESSGATSYHLRALERAGMIAEDERRNGRERWWRRVAERTLIPNSIPYETDEPERSELQAAHAKLESVLVARDEQALSRWQDIRYDVPLDWQDAGFIGGFRIWGTAEEIEQLVRDVLERAHELRQPGRSPDAREVHLTFRALIQEKRPGDRGAGS
ncbi:MAG TPA: winged helix-turn-helix domain-containing protein [Gaiellaceae bacterium]